MALLVVSFLAGILTILAPCVLPVLPVILGGSVSSKQADVRRAILIVTSLGASILVFTLLLKATTALLGVPQLVWQLISGGIITLLGIFFLTPSLWDKLSLRFGVALGSQKLFSKASTSHSFFEPVLIGVALGPVFSSCSPTYAFIVAAVLPGSFAEGLLYLLAYIVGLVLILFVLAFLGQKLIRHLGWALNPHGWFRKVIGIIFILIGLLVIFGGDKALQASVLESGLYDPIESLESKLRQ